MTGDILPILSSWRWLLPEAASTAADETDFVIQFITWVSIFFGMLILVLLGLFIWKYRRRKGELPYRGSGPTHNTAIEVTWTVIPLIIVIIIFAIGFVPFVRSQTPPADAYEVLVEARKWGWTFTYPNGHAEPNVLHVPVDEPVRLVIRSVDVIHSLYIPAFRLKRDAVPGRMSRAWFVAKKPGDYPLYCAEYCGTDHALMIGTVVVHEAGGFEKWLSEASRSFLEEFTEAQVQVYLNEGSEALFAQWPELEEEYGDKVKSPAEQGQQVYRRYGCASCHSLDGTRRIGPSFLGLWEKVEAGNERFRDGTQLRDLFSEEYTPETYIHESIMDPNARIVEGYAAQMQSYRGQISDREVLMFIAYLKSLSQDEGETQE